MTSTVDTPTTPRTDLAPGVAHLTVPRTSRVLPEHGTALRRALSHAAAERAARSRPATAATDTPGEPCTRPFEPAFELPADDEWLTEFFAVTDLRFAPLGRVGNSRLVLLDLMGNPGTLTVKTLASHVIVARAVRHTETTGEPVMLVTPSSANKATALRDAVLRAYRTGLATPAELRIVSLVPDASRAKLWSSALSEDAELAERNPLCVLDADHPAHVKELVARAADLCAEEIRSRYGFRLWHTLDLDNYRCADAVRAFAERDALPGAPGVTRTHAHAVSSAFGLLGHHFGTTLLPEGPTAPQYFLVQHAATPDMVLSLYGTRPPAYRTDPVTGLHHQDSDLHHPATTFSPAEDLEPTFYTRSPATSPAMNALIRGNGGGGIVVSLHECLQRYGQTRALLARGGIALPAAPGTCGSGRLSW